MLERREEQILEGFGEYLRRNKGLSEKSVKDDMSRINMMKKRNVDYTKGEEYAKELLEKSDISISSVISCLRVCRYYKEYIDQWK